MKRPGRGKGGAGSAGGSRPHEAYPVRTVARLTGLSPDLIRAWERRYGVARPIRGPRGARLYSADEIAHLRLLARVVAAGRAIGDVARLDRRSLEKLAGGEEPADARSGHAPVVSRVVEALEQFDSAAAERLLGEALLALGGAGFVRQVAAPLLARVGECWQDGRLTVAGEHLVSGLLRNLLGGLLSRFRESSAPRLVLATPRGERHEFGLLLVAFLAGEGGLRSYYLGPDLPPAEIAAAVRRAKPAAVGLGIVYAGNRQHAVEDVRALTRVLPRDVEIWLGGRDAAATAERLGRTRALLVSDLSQAESEIARVGQAAR